jgi:hypothetical protein
VIAGGDLNTFFYYDDIDKGMLREPAVKSFIDRGHEASRSPTPAAARASVASRSPIISRCSLRSVAFLASDAKAASGQKAR